MAVNYKPDPYHTVTPYLVTADANALVEFIQTVFSAELFECVKKPGGSIGHAELKIGDSVVMVGGKPDAEPSTVKLYIYLEDMDAAYQKALGAGATSVLEPVDQFYGDRNAAVKDPFGNTWWLAKHIKDVPPEELEKLAAEFYGKE